jgi:catechol 2,3-dioxygenase-like lactoylglutathione lyase family enzyme
MSSTEVRNETSTKDPAPGVVDMNLEVIVIAVADPDRAKEFYANLGWRLDADVTRGEDFRLVQFTPSGSGCSVQFGIGLTTDAPGSAQSPYLVVSDVEVARADLVARGVEVSEVFHEGSPGARFHEASRVAGPSPDRSSYGSFATFSDPDGNDWLFQEVTTRLPGRMAHGEHEKRIGEADANWPDWYAQYMVSEQAGQELPS